MNSIVNNNNNSKDDPLVSIIIPVYNVLPYLCEALDSAIHQTYSNLEIIIIDDGSTDGSGKICDDYAKRDQRIYVIHRENKGPGNARNVGLDQMTGELVAFLDPDDAYDITFIEKMKSVMDQELADLVICGHTVHYSSEKIGSGMGGIPEPMIDPRIYDHSDMLLALSRGLIYFSVWDKLYKQELWKNVRFPEIQMGEDHIVTYQIFNGCERVAIIDTPLYFYRRRPGSITTIPSRNALCDCILAYTMVVNYVTENLSGKLYEESLRTYLRLMIALYLTMLRVREDVDKETEEEILRQQIIRIGKEINIEDFKTKTKAVYNMIRFCPWLLRSSYTVYYPIKLFICKLTGKAEEIGEFFIEQ